MVPSHPPSSDPRLDLRAVKEPGQEPAHTLLAARSLSWGGHARGCQSRMALMSQEVLCSQGNRGKVSNSLKQEVVSTETFWDKETWPHILYDVFLSGLIIWGYFFSVLKSVCCPPLQRGNVYPSYLLDIGPLQSRRLLNLNELSKACFPQHAQKIINQGMPLCKGNKLILMSLYFRRKWKGKRRIK